MLIKNVNDNVYDADADDNDADNMPVSIWCLVFLLAATKVRTLSEYEIDTSAVKRGGRGVISFVHKRRRPSAVIANSREEDYYLKPPGKFGNYGVDRRRGQIYESSLS